MSTEEVDAEDTEESGWLSRHVPILHWLPRYDRSWLRNDVIAGLSVWALMVPTSLGYASISGVPVEYGLYAAAIALILFAVFTTSKQVTRHRCLDGCPMAPRDRTLADRPRVRGHRQGDPTPPAAPMTARVI